ncbi:MAG: hypothetical protein ACI4OR_02115 [Alphaproteobacteria bacterium]
MREKQNNGLQQTDFLSLLFHPKTSSNCEISSSFIEPQNKPPRPAQHSRKVLPKNQQAGFRHEYNQAMITLYAFGCLFKSEAEKIYAPPEIKHEVEKAQKTQIRYERHMPKASQKIIHFGRDVIDATMYYDNELSELRAQAENSKYPDKWRMYTMAQNTLNRMVRQIKAYNLN